MPSSASTTHLSPAELSYLHTSLSSHPPIRPDSRTVTDFRPLNAEKGVLPNTMGSAHVGFADGREAVVGVRAEVEKTSWRFGLYGENNNGGGLNNSVTGSGDVEMVDAEGQVKGQIPRGKPEWVTLSLTLPGLRDDDKDLVFLEEMLRETLIAGADGGGDIQSKETEESIPRAQSLRDALVINYRWHWHLYIDVILISAPDHATASTTSSSSGSGGMSSNFPLPLLSMAIHLALRDTKLPKLKSEGDEDPVADDDWDAAVNLYSRKSSQKQSDAGGHPKSALLQDGLVPPVTLLVMVVADNVIFDPSPMELAVADGVLAISVARASAISASGSASSGAGVKIVAVRTLASMARDTMKGVPRDTSGTGTSGEGLASDAVVPGVWKPKVGGMKRAVLMEVIRTVIKGDVGKEVLDGLDGFMGVV